MEDRKIDSGLFVCYNDNRGSDIMFENTEGGYLSYPFLKKQVSSYLKNNFPKNSTVLDLGAGDGIWSSMLKDHFVMDAVEIFEPWVEKFNLKDKYREVFVQDIRDFTFDWYDVIIMGDVLEHFTVEEAKSIMEYLYSRCGELIIAVPYNYEQKLADDGNSYQIHYQPDLTYDVFMERFPMMQIMFSVLEGNKEIYAYFFKHKPIPEQNKNLKIAVYAIAKNEMKHIDQFLDHLKEVDEIVILDTGSTDGTFEYLKSLNDPRLVVGTKIIEPFRFDDARNAALAMISDHIDIAIVVDIDEFFDRDWVNKIKAYWDPQIGRYSHHWIEEYKTSWHKTFIHKNDKNLLWYFPVHEMLGTIDDMPKHDPSKFYPTLPLILYHRPDRVNKKREDFYKSLLEKRIQEDLNNMDSYAKLMYGMVLYSEKKYHEAIAWFEDASEIEDGDYEQQKNKKDSIAWIAKTYNELGLIEYYTNKDYEKSLEYFTKAHEIDPEEKIYLKNMEYPKGKKKKVGPLKIAIYAITKNEEKFAATWYDNMSEADYVTVLDTGSTDKTVEILKEKGAIVETKVIKPWRFDVARNESLKLVPADADICVCTDLDELFEPGWAQNLRDAWQGDTEKMKYLYSWDHDEMGRPKTQIWYEKIHDNSGNWYWGMPVHEALTFRLNREPITHFVEADKLHLHHYPDVSKSRGQYIELMKAGAEEEPDSYMVNYYYGRELMYYNRFSEAIVQLEKVVSMNGSIPANQAAAHGFLGRCYEEVGDIKKAEMHYMRATHFTVGVREPLILLQMFYYRQYRWYALIDAGIAALAIEQRQAEWYENSENYRQVPHDYLSIAYYNIGDYKKALEHINIALSFKPEDERMQNNLKLIENKL